MARASKGSQAAKSRLSKTVKERQSAMAAMNPALAGKFEELSELFETGTSSTLRFYFDVGRVCLAVRQDAATYGQNAVGLFEKALATSARTLRRAAQFADAYDQNEFDWLLEQAHPDTDFRLQWGHVAHLLTLRSRQDRERYTEEAISKMLDPAALHKLLRARSGTEGGHGRKHKQLATPQQAVVQMLKFTKQWTVKCATVWRSPEQDALVALTKLALDESDNELLDTLQELRAELQLLSEQSTAATSQVDRVVEHLKTRLESKRDAVAQRVVATKAAAAGRPVRRITVGR